MFRHRTSSQKPSDQLYADFKNLFPGLSDGGSASAAAAVAASQAAPPGIIAASSSSQDPTVDASHIAPDEHVGKDHDFSGQGAVDNWRLTPLLDPNSFSLASFSNQQPGYCTPTPGGLNTVYHNQTAGDLHTPGMALQLGTPLSMPVPEPPLHAGSSFDLHTFNPQVFHNQPLQANQFAMQSQTFAPAMLIHEDSGYGPMERSPEDGLNFGHDLRKGSQGELVPAPKVGGPMNAPPQPTTEKFRWHVTLNAPTAMVRSQDEIPITYLNKGQAYTITIVDSMPLNTSVGPVKYRTVVRISFEDESQRQRPSACWQLWKEGRGLAESHQRGGKLQAVEYVDPHPGADDDPRRPRIELESTSFDCFAATWIPPASSSGVECSIAVRFNFLSTDFSHSKGVKGIPVRLCAKTEVISSGTPDTPPLAKPEVCYCKVKLFRDHGAERKLSNDVAHVKKTIEKLKQQIAQSEAGIKDVGKRKRTASMAAKIGGERPAKLAKHNRTWSVSSQGSSGRPAVEEDLHQKLAGFQDMFTSTRPVSVLYLKGADKDDPDAYPVSLPREPLDSGLFQANRPDYDRKRSGEMSDTGSSIDSPVPFSKPSLNEGHIGRPSISKQSRHASADWPLSATFPSHEHSSLFDSSITTPFKVKKRSTGSALPEWIEAIGVDSTYVPPPEHLPKPVACFYVKVQTTESKPRDDYYRAVYLLQRSVVDLVSSIASKSFIDPSRVQRSIRVTPRGIRVLVDEELVREIPEGQDMTVEFATADSNASVKFEGAVSAKADLGLMAQQPLEMRLFF